MNNQGAVKQENHHIEKWSEEALCKWSIAQD